ncbi:FecCD family ABC transporter permease [Luethyella okanaganae]|uniref:FecCD family ABC transporter permease n=1 Tax=Luethyella okanaganae TaxID=69372 RepID=A0ABW1VDD2_9MICO
MTVGIVRIAVLAVCLVALSVLGIGIGAVFVPPEAVIAALADPSAPGSFIVVQYRLPRVVGGVLAGAALAVSGVLLQAALRNPLASPDVIGVSKGAGLGALLAIMLLPASTVAVIPIAVVVGAAVAAALLLLLARGRSGVASIALTGIAVGALCQAGMQFLLVSFPGDTNQAMIWLAGSLYGTTMPEVVLLGVWLFVCAPLVVLAGRRLDLAGLNETSMISLGTAPNRLRGEFIALAVALAAGGVAVVGGIGFIGLLAPHLAGRLVGRRAHLLLPAAALLGALLLGVADVLGRIVATPSEVPAGIVTAVVGAPYLLHLLGRETRIRA